MKVIRGAAAIVTGITLLIGGSGTAMAEETRCRGTIGDKTVDNLKVPAGKRCVLEGTTVKGTIKVGRKATLIARGVRVVGNVQAENARKVVVRRGSRIGGSVQIVQGRAALIRGTKVNADILFDDQRGEVRAKGNNVGGNIQAFQNTGGVVIKNNVVDGNLQCKENQPAPTGGGNKVEGSKEDQCSGL
ncbi:MAG: hypothetical protein ACRDKB_10740 [Actinomycetota bacterium]